MVLLLALGVGGARSDWQMSSCRQLQYKRAAESLARGCGEDLGLQGPEVSRSPLPVSDACAEQALAT